MMLASLLPLLALAGLARAELQERQSSWTVGQTVQTSSGPINGHAASNATEVSEYLGIPFADPPVGDLRFAPPQKYSGNSTINGTSFGFSCPAATISTAGITPGVVAAANITAGGFEFLEIVNQVGDKFSEDCLTLNVWTKPQTGDSKKAVLVWIYGGSFIMGNSDNVGYDGKFLADQEDVVIVSLNYRLNIFGFPGSPNTTQNLALLDQRLAVEWVRDNIEKFGGDSSRITLFGQSAGGESVDYYSYAWTSDPIVSSFIPESGVATGGGPHTAADIASSWYQVASKLGCGNSSSDGTAVLSCMRTKSSEAILASLPTTGLAGNTDFGPTIDEKVVFSDYLSRSAAGNFIKRPLLVGNANNEAGLFKAVAALSGTSSLYSESYWDRFNEAFDCPVAARANISVANGVPTWRYRWFGEFPNTIITTVPDSGAWHGSELPILFDTVVSGPGIPGNTPEEIAIGSYLRGAWAAFAKDPVNGLRTYSGGNGTGWPTYEPGQDTLIRLAYNNQTGANLGIGDLYDSGCNVTFSIPASASANGTTNGTGYPSGTAPASTVTNSGGVRIEMTAGLVIMMAGLGFAL